MSTQTVTDEALIPRRVFETWWIAVPATFRETFVEEDAYWHAWDDERSVSLTSMIVTDGRRPVAAVEMEHIFPELDGAPVDERPPGLIGRAVTGPSVAPARAATLLSGVLATDGRLLIVTITADDLDWGRRVWLSIRPHGASPRGADRSRSRRLGRRRVH